MITRIELASDEFYHIYNRGTEKRTVFATTTDYERFLSSLYLCNNDRAMDLKLQGSTLYDACQINRSETLVDVCAYSLMPNHFHLILREKNGGGISKFMQKLVTGYTMYFNKKNARTGALFQGRYKAKHANKDEYLSYLISYIHLNPLSLIAPKWNENGIVSPTRAEIYLEKYRYSSYLDYLGNARVESAIVTTNALPEYCETPLDFKTNMKFWIEYRMEYASTLQGQQG